MHLTVCVCIMYITIIKGKKAMNLNKCNVGVHGVVSREEKETITIML